MEKDKDHIVKAVLLTRGWCEIFSIMMEELKETNFYRQDMKVMMNKLETKCREEITRWYKELKEEEEYQGFYVATTLIADFNEAVKKADLHDLIEISEFVRQYNEKQVHFMSDPVLKKILNHFHKAGKLGMTYEQSVDWWKKNEGE